MLLFVWAGPQTTHTIKTSERTGVEKYSLLYFFTEVDGPRAARKAPEGLVNAQVAQENLRYRSPTVPVGYAGRTAKHSDRSD